jgi:hypothetical protein
MARARDLSMRAFHDGPLSRLPSEIDMRIPLPGQGREVQTTCRVERTDSDGVALSFSKIGWSDLLLMARFLSPRL